MRALKAEFSMSRSRPVTQLRNGAAPGKRLGLRACLMLGAGILCVTAMVAQAPKAAPDAKPAAIQAKDAAPNTYVGGDVCATCHEEVSKKFEGNPHTKLAAQHGAAGVNCEGCMGCHTPHGSQNARLLNMPSINLLCNQCHSRVANATVHGMGAGSDELAPCTSCHTYIHGSNMNAAFLR